MGALDEIGQEFMNMVLAILAIVGFVVVFLAFSVSIWLLVALLVVVVGGYAFYKSKWG